MLDKPFAGFRRRTHRTIPEPEPCGIAPLVIALLSSLGGALMQKMLEKPQPGQVGKALDTSYKPTTTPQQEALANSQAGGGKANVGQALAAVAAQNQQPAPLTPPGRGIGEEVGSTPYDVAAPKYPGAPGATGMGAEVGGKPAVDATNKANAAGEGSWMEAAKMGAEVGGQVAESVTPKEGPTGGVVAKGHPTMDTTVPTAKDRLLRYLAMMQGQARG